MTTEDWRDRWVIGAIPASTSHLQNLQKKPGMVVPACNSGNGETDAGKSQGLSGLPAQFQVNSRSDTDPFFFFLKKTG